MTYAGFVLCGRTKSTSCSCLIHVVEGGSAKFIFMKLIQAAVTKVYYKNLSNEIAKDMRVVYETAITPVMCFLFG